MPLSNIAIGVPIATVQAALNLRATNPAGFRSAFITFMKNHFPTVTLTAADFTSRRVTVMIHMNGYVGIGRGLTDAMNAAVAAHAAANP